MMNRIYFSSLLVFVCLLGVQAQNGQLSKVFQLGTEEQRYEQLTSVYSQSLLEAANGNITTAFEGWLDMQQAMDRHAERVNFDLNGVKVWLHVFWNEQGQIDQLGYLLRPDSKLVDDAELRAFLADFIGQYTFPIRSGRKFSHYTGATFPTVSQRKM
ncbi:MAG: hypothetical protein D6772_07455 [Bacteroidetes bacterium]|nr:MAG: hypothetical protein D6772_07455 [Bacteroidota bacterium]